MYVHVCEGREGERERERESHLEPDGEVGEADCLVEDEAAGAGVGDEGNQGREEEEEVNQVPETADGRVRIQNQTIGQRLHSRERCMYMYMQGSREIPYSRKIWRAFNFGESLTKTYWRILNLARQTMPCAIAASLILVRF